MTGPVAPSRTAHVANALCAAGERVRDLGTQPGTLGALHRARGRRDRLIGVARDHGLSVAAAAALAGVSIAYAESLAEAGRRTPAAT